MKVQSPATSPRLPRDLKHSVRLASRPGRGTSPQVPSGLNRAGPEPQGHAAGMGTTGCRNPGALWAGVALADSPSDPSSALPIGHRTCCAGSWNPPAVRLRELWADPPLRPLCRRPWITRLRPKRDLLIIHRRRRQRSGAGRGL